MSFSAGIVGLPNVGKSTLFKALTKKAVDIAPYPFTTINPNIGVVAVPDKRLEKISEIIRAEKITPTIIEFVDIAGLVKGAHRGEGLGNQFLANIRNCDAILEVIRGFQNEKVENVLGKICPEKEIDTIRTELLMKDLEALNNTIAKAEKKQDTESLKKIEVFKKIKEGVSQGKAVSEINLTKEEKEEIKEYQFLTQKPIFYVLNTDEKTELSGLGFDYLEMNLKTEKEISELSEEELKELRLASQLDKLILNCYNILDLITFYTIAGGKETRAWTLKHGQSALDAGGVVHTDFKEKFIKAEVIFWKKLVEAGRWREAREKGWLKTVGKDYIVQDGDVIEFKI